MDGAHYGPRRPKVYEAADRTRLQCTAPAASVAARRSASRPFIRSASGEVRPGARLSVTIQPPGRDPLSFEPTLIVVRPDRELRWRGKLWLSGLFDGEHVFEIEPLAEDRVRLRHFETFDGVLVPLLGGVLADTEEGFRAMNAALKEQAER